MTFVMSDIHGKYNRYLDILWEINFSSADTLYILGDMIDRGPDGVALVKDIMKRGNVHALIGNHELIFMAVLEDGDLTPCQKEGGQPTLDAFFALPEDEQRETLQYFESLPDHLDIKVGRKRFHLVHGWPGKTTAKRVLRRPELTSRNPFWDRRRVIIGHTPIFMLNKEHLIQIALGSGYFPIEKTNGFVDIDCGCGYPMSQRRLVCLRLDDMAEFYT